jgi:hypothetical protein
MTASAVARLVKQKQGLLLDISLGGIPQARSVSMSPTGDLAHDPRSLPFPLPNRSVNTAVVTHVLEYLHPREIFAWFDELWRVMQPLGLVYMNGPYGGEESHGWLSDPQHQTRIMESTFAWLDPRTPMYTEHVNRGRATPKPWYTLTTARVPGTYGSISYNVVLQAQPEPK